MNRANIVLIDEFRMVKKHIVDTVMKKFLTQQRMPDYSSLTNAERIRAWNEEENMMMFLSSAYYVNNWSYVKCQDTFRAMLNPRNKQFICGIPYQCPLECGLLRRSTIEDELLESEFNEITFSMEYEARWYGSSAGSFFDFDSVAKNRKISYPMYPNDTLPQSMRSDTKLKIPKKLPGEKRLLSVDVALMQSTKNDNDAAAIFINQLLPTKAGRYINNIVYPTADEGLRTQEQALRIRRAYEEFECDYIVLDCQGNGLGVFDMLATDMVDPETGEIYPALSCCNNQEMADRCTDIRAPKVIWSIKASAQFNNDCAILLREGFRSGKIRLLENEYDARELLAELPKYKSLTEEEKSKLLLPYIHTTLLIDELINLQHDESSGKIKLKERTGWRKDRYSSLAYNYYVATQLEARLSRKRREETSSPERFLFRAPRTKRG